MIHHAGLEVTGLEEANVLGTISVIFASCISTIGLAIS
jgi:hypothetical protein